MGENHASRNARQDISDLHDRCSKLRKSLAKLADDIEEARERASKKEKAMKRKAKREADFKASITNGGDELSRADVAAFSKAQYDFELTDETLDAVMTALEPITMVRYQRMRGMCAIAKSEAIARKRRAEEEERWH